MADALAQYNPHQYNVLVPTQTIQQVSPWHAIRVSEVKVNPSPDGGEVFSVGSRGSGQNKVELFTLGKPALMRIAAAAGIVWNWRDSGTLGPPTATYVAYRAVGAVRLPDGSWQPIMATKEIDLTVIEEELMEANLKTAREWEANPEKRSWLHGATPEAWAAAKTKSAMIQWRKNKLMRAETGAMERVIKAALGIKSQYTAAELSRPFVVPRIDFAPDYNDPDVRQALIDNGVAGMAKLYGPTAPAAQAALTVGQAMNSPIVAPEEDADAADAFRPGVEAEEPVGEIGPLAGQAGGVDADIDEALAGASQAPAAPAAQPSKEPIADCSACKKQITNGKVVDYSLAQFGRILCYSCQQKAKGGEQAS